MGASFSIYFLKSKRIKRIRHIVPMQRDIIFGAATERNQVIKNCKQNHRHE